MDSLLNSLSNAEGDLTENVALIESLEQSKALADEISEKVRPCATDSSAISTTCTCNPGLPLFNALY
jgi:dynein heavy chain